MTPVIEKWIEEQTYQGYNRESAFMSTKRKWNHYHKEAARETTKYILEELGVLECLRRFKLGQWPDGRYLSARQSEVLAKETLEKLGVGE